MAVALEQAGHLDELSIFPFIAPNHLERHHDGVDGRLDQRARDIVLIVGQIAQHILSQHECLVIAMLKVDGAVRHLLARKRSEPLWHSRKARHAENEPPQHRVWHLEVVFVFYVAHGQHALHHRAAFLHQFLILRLLRILFLAFLPFLVLVQRLQRVGCQCVSLQRIGHNRIGSQHTCCPRPLPGIRARGHQQSERQEI